MSADSTPDSGAQNGPSPNYALTILFFVMMFNFVDRQVITILAEAIKKDMGLSDGQIGLMTGLSFALFYTILSIPIAALADRWNRSKIIAISVAVWSIMTILCGVATNYTQMLLARIGVGVGEAGASPASHSLIADLFPPERRSGALGILGMAVPLGSFVAFTSGGWLVENVGWRIAFILAGAPGLIIAALLWFTVRDPRGTTSIAQALKPRKGEVTLRDAIGELSKKRAYWHLVISGVAISFVAYGMASFYAGLFIRIHDIGYTELGWKLGVMIAISGSAGAWIGGKTGDYLNSRMPAGALIASGFMILLGIPAFILGIYAPSANLTFIYFGIPTFAFTFYYGPCFAAVQTLASDRTRAMSTAIWLLITGLFGLSLGPVFVGYLSDIFAADPGMTEGTALQKAMAITAFFNIIAAISFWRAQVWIKRDLKKAHIETPEQSAG